MPDTLPPTAARPPAPRPVRHWVPARPSIVTLPEYPPADEGPPAARTAALLRLLRPFLTPDGVYLEIGAGSGHLACAVAREVRFAYGSAASPPAAWAADRPGNLDLMTGDPVIIPLADDRVSVAFSDVLVGKLDRHELDRHFREVARVLLPGGVYVCRAPYRHAGSATGSPDIREATPSGFSFRALARRLTAAGFASIGMRLLVRGRTVPCPGWVAWAVDSAVGLLPARPPAAVLTVVAWKSRHRAVRHRLPEFLALA